MLTDIFKNMENLTINQDKAVIQILEKSDGSLLDETLTQELKNIENLRHDHKNHLV